MKLTRRDALKALAVGTGASSGGLAVSEAFVRMESTDVDPVLSDAELTTTEAVAETVYPSEIEVTREFIDTYVDQLTDERVTSMAQSIEDLEEFTRARHGKQFHELSRSARDSTLRSLGVNRAASRPDGDRSEQIKFYLVNSLLYLLFSRPQGSRLVGIENPDGYPGGFAVYRDQMHTKGDQ